LAGLALSEFHRPSPNRSKALPLAGVHPYLCTTPANGFAFCLALSSFGQVGAFFRKIGPPNRNVRQSLE